MTLSKKSGREDEQLTLSKKSGRKDEQLTYNPFFLEEKTSKKKVVEVLKENVKKSRKDDKVAKDVGKADELSIEGEDEPAYFWW